MFGEPLAYLVNQDAVAKRVDRAGGHLDDVGSIVGGQRPPGGHRTDGGHHEVDRDDVDGSFGNAGKLLQEATGVRDDDRLGHSEATDPAGRWLGEGRFDDGRTDHADRHTATGLGGGDLAEGLGVGIGVGEAERGGPGDAGFGHAVVNPSGSQLLGLGSQARRAGSTEFAVSLGAEFGEALRGAAGRLGLVTDAPGRVDLGAPVDVDEERAGIDGLLGGGTPTATGHVTGGHGHHMGGHTQLGQGFDDSDRSQQVDLDGLVQW